MNSSRSQIGSVNSTYRNLSSYSHPELAPKLGVTLAAVICTGKEMAVSVHTGPPKYSSGMHHDTPFVDGIIRT
jgi:hypothetical protein